MKRKELFINPTTNEFFLRTWNLEWKEGKWIGQVCIGAEWNLSAKDDAIRNKFIAGGWMSLATVHGFNVSLMANEPFKSVNSISVLKRCK